MICVSVDPYTYTGTAPFFDCTALRKRAHDITHIAIASTVSASGSESPRQAGMEHVWAITANVLFRKDDIPAIGRKAATRKWSSQGVILCNRQILCYVSAAKLP